MTHPATRPYTCGKAPPGYEGVNADMNAKGRIRLLCLLLCLAVLMPCVSALSETTKVTGYLLRLREEASTDGKVIDAYPRGTKVTILKKGDTWTKVSVKGNTGYMMTCYLAYSKDKQVRQVFHSD